MLKHSFVIRSKYNGFGNLNERILDENFYNNWRKPDKDNEHSGTWYLWKNTYIASFEEFTNGKGLNSYEEWEWRFRKEII